jgi:hypothetical protein
LELLQGTRESLRYVQVVELEVSLVQLYAGQPSLADVSAWLREHAFVLTSMEPEFIDPSSREILQVNVLFVRI